MAGASLLRASGLSALLPAIGVAVLVGFIAFGVKLYQMRMLVRRVSQEHGIPIMPHSIFFGHLPAVIKASIKHKIPPDLNGTLVFTTLAKEYPEAAKFGIVYLDAWPMSAPLACVIDPEMMAQFTQDVSLPKWWAHESTFSAFKPFTNDEDLVHLEGQEWKQARAMFNPGFSHKNLMSMLPQFIQEVLIFREKLFSLASSRETVKLEPLTTLLTIDVVALAVLGARLQVQQKPVPMITAMSKQVSLLYFSMDLRKMLNPFGPLSNRFWGNKFREAAIPYIQETVQEQGKTSGPRTIVGLAVKSQSQGSELPTKFVNQLVNHVKMFMFAGHDSTATTLAFIYYLLSTYPDTLHKIRQEHDEIFGSDAAEAADLLLADPTLLNKLPYTAAVLKEALRMYSPFGGTARYGTEGFALVHPKSGQKCPIGGFMVHASGASSQWDPSLFHDPERFVPERWLGLDASDPYRAPKLGWRPFEMGPRNCIGQELVNIEVRLVLALTVREFDFEAMYEKTARTWRGTPAYQIETREHPVSSHATGGMPVRISLTPRKA